MNAKVQKLFSFPKKELFFSRIMNAFMIYCNFTLLILAMAKKKLKEQEIIQRTLKDYDWHVRPRGSNLSWPGKCIMLVVLSAIL